MVITPALLIARTRDALSRNEERLFAYAWRLRQLLPLEARTAALPTGAPPVPAAQRRRVRRRPPRPAPPAQAGVIASHGA